MTTREFVDTNVLVYAFVSDPRTPRAESLLASGCVTGVQALNEFANVARRKLGFDWDEVGDALRSIRALCSVIVPLDMDVHEGGLRLAQRYQFTISDSLMAAAALRSGCETLWTEDMHDGLMVDEMLRIANPFTVG